MGRALARRITAYLSTNHPVLWATRLDIALLLGLGLWALYIPLLVVATQVGAPGQSDFTPAMRTGLSLVLTALSVAALFFWFSSAQRANYRDIAPSMQKHPSIIALFVASALLLLPSAPWIMALSNVPLFTGSFWDIARQYLLFAIEPALVLATILFLLLRLSLRSVLMTLLLDIGVILVFLWVYAVTRDFWPVADATAVNLPASNFLLGYSVACLAIVIALAGSGRNAGWIRTLVRLAIPMVAFIVLMVAGVSTNDLIKLYIEPHGLNWNTTDYWAVVVLGLHCIVSLLIVQWLATRWTWLNLAPK
jgi:hypothetical protein